MATIRLLHAGPNLIQVVRVLRELFGWGLVEAKACAEGKTQTWNEARNMDEARKARNWIRDQLTNVGVQLSAIEILPDIDPRLSGKTWHQRLLEDDG